MPLPADNVSRMARKIVHQLIDDLDHTALGAGEGETVNFALDGKTYEIDLSDAHASEMREAFARYISAARRLSVKGGVSASAKGERRSRSEVQAIRQWARENGHELSDRGRIPADIAAAYANAH